MDTNIDAVIIKLVDKRPNEKSQEYSNSVPALFLLGIHQLVGTHQMTAFFGGDILHHLMGRKRGEIDSILPLFKTYFKEYPDLLTANIILFLLRSEFRIPLVLKMRVETVAFMLSATLELIRLPR